MSEDTLQAIENCGAAEMPTAETCAIAEITEAEYWADAEAQRRYRIGQLRSKMEIRQAVIKMAKAGVPQMVKVYQDFVAETDRDIPPTKTPDGEDGGEFDGI